MTLSVHHSPYMMIYHEFGGSNIDDVYLCVPISVGKAKRCFALVRFLKIAYNCLNSSTRFFSKTHSLTYRV